MGVSRGSPSKFSFSGSRLHISPGAGVVAVFRSAEARTSVQKIYRFEDSKNDFLAQVIGNENIVILM